MHGRVAKLKPLLSKRNIKAHVSIAKEHLAYPQNFWDDVIWTDESNMELFGRPGSHYIWCKADTAFHNKDIMPTVLDGGDIVMVRG